MSNHLTLTDDEILPVRKACLRHLFVFAKTVLGYDDIIEELHGDFCRFLEGPEDRKQATLPRGFVKTWLGTIAYSIWISLPRTSPDEFPPAAITRIGGAREKGDPSSMHFGLSPSSCLSEPSNPIANKTNDVEGPHALPFLSDPLPAAAGHGRSSIAMVPLPGHDDYFVDPLYLIGSNIRILIASYVVGNSMKMVGLIRKTYERNQMMMVLFPEVIPENFTKVKWADTEACINRPENFTESTFEAGGIGGSTTSRHYDMIIEDDLIYANKDDFTGRELMPSQEDIDKAIGWHKLAMSLLTPGIHTKIHNIGTRWAKKDLVQYIRENEPSYVVFNRAITKDAMRNGEPTWPSMYPPRKIEQIYASQGPYMFATQYLCKPTAPEDMTFKLNWLQYYVSPNEIPSGARIFTTTDLSLWSKSAKKGHDSRGVIITCAWDSNNHCWILRYDVARFNPSEIFDLWYTHFKLFNPEIIGVEAVYFQKAMLHFAKLEMEKKGWLPIRELKTSTHVDKDVRIRGLEPYALNGALHCRKDHEDFIKEYCEFTPGSDHCTKDILDALAYQLQLARPGVASVVEETKGSRLRDYKFSVDMDKVMEELHKGKQSKGPFKEYELTTALSPEEDAEFEELMAPLELNG